MGFEVEPKAMKKDTYHSRVNESLSMVSSGSFGLKAILKSPCRRFWFRIQPGLSMALQSKREFLEGIASHILNYNFSV